MLKAKISLSLWGTILFLCTAAAVLLVLYPIWIIRPFAAQHPASLELALRFIRVAPLVTALIWIAGLLIAIALWRATSQVHSPARRRVPARAAVLTALVLLTASAALARINIFERMFNPVKSVRFLPIAGTVVDPHDMVMAVNVGGKSHAYPIRTMAYHHAVNDVVGGLPLVATY